MSRSTIRRAVAVAGLLAAPILVVLTADPASATRIEPMDNPIGIWGIEPVDDPIMWPPF